MRDRATATLTTIVVDDEQLACDELVVSCSRISRKSM